MCVTLPACIPPNHNQKCSSPHGAITETRPKLQVEVTYRVVGVHLLGLISHVRPTLSSSARSFP